MIYHTTNTKMPVKWVDNSPVNKKWRYLDYEVSPLCYILFVFIIKYSLEAR